MYTDEDNYNAMTTLKALCPSFEDENSVIRGGVSTIDYMKSCPEDLVEGRQTFDDLKDNMDSLRYAFEKVYSVLIKVGERINYDDCTLTINE